MEEKEEGRGGRKWGEDGEGNEPLGVGLLVGVSGRLVAPQNSSFSHQFPELGDRDA